MPPGPYRTQFSLVVRARWLISTLLLISLTEVEAQKHRSNVVCRDELSAKHRNDLAGKLQKITGWSDLDFDREGALRVGSKEALRGSKGARELITKAIDGPNVVILEDASERSDVVFCRVVPGRWKHHPSENPDVYVVLIDFADFKQVTGDEQARAAFDVGWGVLHELEHVVHDSHDADLVGTPGDCEEHINKMRQELGLPVRTDYFFRSLPLSTDANFTTRFVRIAFEQNHGLANKTKRYWLVWDAATVGGLPEQGQVASARSPSSLK